MKYRIKDRMKNGIEFLLGMGTVAYIKSTEISNQFVSGNVPDVIYPITNYTLLRVLSVEKPSALVALGIAALGTAGEIAQKFGLWPGAFDLKDIPMYFIGAGIAYAIDKVTYKNKAMDLENRLTQTHSIN